MTPQNASNMNTPREPDAAPKPVLGISACLLGHPVRYDGGHKQQHFITDTVSDYFELLPICPEVDIGLGVPRPTIQIRQTDDHGTLRLVNPRRSDGDLTDTMQTYARDRVANLGDLAGYIFKKDSPSCGMERVPIVINGHGQRLRQGVGFYAREFIERWPLIPVEDEGRLNDVSIRENFFERVYALLRWRAIEDPQRNVAGLIDFHARHKLLIMARGHGHYRELGQLVAGTTRQTLADHRATYIERFMRILAKRPSRGHHVNVLQHILGYFKNDLDSADKQELLNLFERYRRYEIPLITPLTLLRHHLRRMPDAYLNKQCYLDPYPESLALRSHLQ